MPFSSDSLLHSSLRPAPSTPGHVRRAAPGHGRLGSQIRHPAPPFPSHPTTSGLASIPAPPSPPSPMLASRSCPLGGLHALPEFVDAGGSESIFRVPSAAARGRSQNGAPWPLPVGASTRTGRLHSPSSRGVLLRPLRRASWCGAPWFDFESSLRLPSRSAQIWPCPIRIELLRLSITEGTTSCKLSIRILGRYSSNRRWTFSSIIACNLFDQIPERVFELTEWIIRTRMPSMINIKKVCNVKQCLLDPT
ncbi:hypothetical protein PVAP13_8KG122800 [Panicum virgatum]|uniref:Uncharacterized protein n=1 Tax=Panicum virgatum TaxID=38727 RepID=A0A8T0PIJ0_PANVG|nr:hypothetical protein PVAP13_8KG122800 [Panicum virgatum]